MSLQDVFGSSSSTTTTTTSSSSSSPIKPTAASLRSECRTNLTSLKKYLLEDVAAVMERIETLNDAKQNASVVRAISNVKKELQYFELPKNIRYVAPPFSTSDATLLDYQKKVHHALWEVHARIHFIESSLVMNAEAQLSQVSSHLKTAISFVREFLNAQNMPIANVVPVSSSPSTATAKTAMPAPQRVSTVSTVSAVPVAQQAVFSTVTPSTVNVATTSTSTAAVVVPQKVVISTVVAATLQTATISTISASSTATTTNNNNSSSFDNDDDLPKVTMLNMRSTVQAKSVESLPIVVTQVATPSTIKIEPQAVPQIASITSQKAVISSVGVPQRAQIVVSQPSNATVSTTTTTKQTPTTVNNVNNSTSTPTTTVKPSTKKGDSLDSLLDLV